MIRKMSFVIGFNLVFGSYSLLTYRLKLRLFHWEVVFTCCVLASLRRLFTPLRVKIHEFLRLKRKKPEFRI